MLSHVGTFNKCSDLVILDSCYCYLFIVYQNWQGNLKFRFRLKKENFSVFAESVLVFAENDSVLC
jgi:hypothetical protein